MLVQKRHPFQRDQETLHHFNGVVADRELFTTLDEAWTEIGETNRPLRNWLRAAGGVVLARQIDKGQSEEAAGAIQEAYLDGAIISYYTLRSPYEPMALPLLYRKMIEQSLREAPKSDYEELTWHFAIEEDDVLRSILDLAMMSLGHSTLLTPAVYNGAGVVNHLFNDQAIRSN